MKTLRNSSYIFLFIAVLVIELLIGIFTEFSIPGIDKYGNQYLVTSNREELLINSIYIEQVNLNIDYISTDVVFDHLGQFPIVRLSNEEVSSANNKISAVVGIDYKFNFNSNIYIVKEK